MSASGDQEFVVSGRAVSHNVKQLAYLQHLYIDIFPKSLSKVPQSDTP